MPSKLHNQLVEYAGRHLRSMNHWPVLCEPDSLGEECDAISWSSDVLTHVIECKASRADFARDRLKAHRQNPRLGCGDFRWFLVPAGLIESYEVEEFGWGLLEWDGHAVVVKQKSELFFAKHVLREIRYLRVAVRNLELAGVRTADESRPSREDKPTEAFAASLEKARKQGGDDPKILMLRVGKELATLAGSKPRARRWIKQLLEVA